MDIQKRGKTVFVGLVIFSLLMLFAIQAPWTVRSISPIDSRRLTEEINEAHRLPRFGHEVRHIGYLKVHKAASTTVQNIMYRFGLERNLSFVLPIGDHYLSRNRHSYAAHLPPLPLSGTTQHGNNNNNNNKQSYKRSNNKYDIICNHCSFNWRIFDQLLHPDAVYIGSVRDPLDLFISAAFYYKFVWRVPYLHRMNKDTFITDLIHDPRMYEHENPRKSRTLNKMAFDFGYPMSNVDEVLGTSEEDIEQFVNYIGKAFKFAMIVERFEESLVMMRRMLNWSFVDILFLKSNEYIPKNGVKYAVNLTEEDKNVFKNRNRIDYALYNFFLERFQKQISHEENIAEEVKDFRHVLGQTRSFCSDSGRGQNASRVRIPATHWHTVIELSKGDCRLMKLGEMEMFELVKRRHRKMYMDQMGIDID